MAARERWPVKTGTDPGAPAIRSAPVPATVRELVNSARPDQLPLTERTEDAQTTRYGSVENTVYRIDADIVRWKLEESDGDYHIVIRDHADYHGPTMIVEIPDPDQVDPSSAWYGPIRVARLAATDRLAPTPRFTRRVVHAVIMGVGFYDFLHSQSGVAPNGVELHPVIAVDFPDQ